MAAIYGCVDGSGDAVKMMSRWEPVAGFFFLTFHDVMLGACSFAFVNRGK